MSDEANSFLTAFNAANVQIDIIFVEPFRLGPVF